MSAAITEGNRLTRQLWHIAGSGDLEELDQLVSQGADVNAGDRTGVTALMRAAYHGQLGMVRALIGYGADPNAKDRSGLDALMMAEHGGHDEIVEALRRFSPQGKREVAREPRLIASVTEDTDSVRGGGTGVPPVNHAQDARATFPIEYNDWESGKNSHAVRTLHEPLEIWEMVHTTQAESYSPSIDSRRILSPRILALGGSAIIFCTVAAFGFLTLRGAMRETGDTSQQQPSSNQQLSASESLTKAPGKGARSSNELTKLKPMEELTSESVGAPRAASSVSSAKKLSASQRPKATKVSATVPKQNKTVRRPAKLEGEQDASAKSAKKEPAPASSDPVKPSTTQKPKVIPWP